MAKAGLGLAVVLSVLLLPVSVAAVMSGADVGAAGPWVSMVTASALLAALALPAASVAVTLRLYTPSASVARVALQVPSAATTALPNWVLPS